MRNETMVAECKTARQEEGAVIAQVVSRSASETPQLVGKGWAVCIVAQKKPAS